MTTAHHNGHEHEFEPQYGLPETLPASESVLWQGVPQRGRIAQEVFHLRAVMIYFAIILGLRFAFQIHDGGSVGEALAAVTWLLPVFALGCLLLWLLAHLVQQTTVYTITDRRVVMRVGIVLSLTFNLPFARIQSAQVRRRPDGGGDIVLELVSGDKIAWPHLWPHVRPWRIAWPQPMLRGLSEVDRPAGLLREAWLAAQASHSRQGNAAQVDSSKPLVEPTTAGAGAASLSPAGAHHVAAH